MKLTDMYTPASLPAQGCPGRVQYPTREQSNNSWHWTPLSSGVSLILMMLLSQHAHAAGVCIVCPPGYDCPAGGAPVLGGNFKQILRRGETGMEWVSVSHAIFADVTGVTGTIATIHDVERLGERADANLPEDMRCALRRFSIGPNEVHGICHNSSTSVPLTDAWGTSGRYCWCSFLHGLSNDDLECPIVTPVFVQAFGEPQGCTGHHQGPCITYCRRNINWRLPSRHTN